MMHHALRGALSSPTTTSATTVAATAATTAAVAIAIAIGAGAGAVEIRCEQRGAEGVQRHGGAALGVWLGSKLTWWK